MFCGGLSPENCLPRLIWITLLVVCILYLIIFLKIAHAIEKKCESGSEFRVATVDVYGRCAGSAEYTCTLYFTALF